MNKHDFFGCLFVCMFTVLSYFMLKKRYILFCFLCFTLMPFQAQVNIISQRGVEFSVRIIIVDENNQKITKNVEVLAAGIYYSNPDIAGRFIIKGKVDDQI